MEGRLIVPGQTEKIEDKEQFITIFDVKDEQQPTNSEDDLSISSNQMPPSKYEAYLDEIRRIEELNSYQRNLLNRKVERRNQKVLKALTRLSEETQIMVILCGIPGSGKTTFAQKVINTYCETYYHEGSAILNQNPSTLPTKHLAFLRAWAWYTQDQFQSRKVMETYCREALSQGYHLIVDRCNFDVEQRKHWIGMIHEIYGSLANRSSPHNLQKSLHPFYILAIILPDYNNVKLCANRAFNRGADGLHAADTDWNMVCSAMMNSFIYPSSFERIDGVYHCTDQKDLEKIFHGLLFSS